MSRTIQCDNCGSTVGPLDHNGEDASGEIYAWIHLAVKDDAVTVDACSRSCAHELIDGAFGEAVEKHYEPIAEISRVIREQESGGSES